jgi:hypothetical protein
MWRIVASHKHKAEWWREHQDGLGCEWPSGDHAEGVRAYGSKYMAMHKGLLTKCKQIWAQGCEKPVENSVVTTLDVPPMIKVIVTLIAKK